MTTVSNAKNPSFQCKTHRVNAAAGRWAVGVAALLAGLVLPRAHAGETAPDREWTRMNAKVVPMALAGETKPQGALPGTLPGVEPKGVPAVATADFLDSIGICTTFPDRGQPLDVKGNVDEARLLDLLRAAIEGVTDRGPTTMQTFLDLHRQTGVRFSWGLGSGGSNLPKLIETARILAAADVLLAFEGNNEPNNWGITYQGEKGGGRGATTWLPVAKLHRDLYEAVKRDPLLRKYPVWSTTETGAQVDNTGLQFLTIPEGAETLMPAGTRYADYTNCHNYFYHPNVPHPEDNKTWNAADPTSACRVDGLYGNFGRTWLKKFPGYPEGELPLLPRVTTETGCLIDKHVTEDLQAVHYVNVYLAQFKRGWSYTSIYILRDRTDEAGNQSFGFYRRDYSPRKAALFLHNFTTILNDRGRATTTGRLDYRLPNQPATVHDLLLQRSDGAYQLVVWGERLKGEDKVTVRFGSEQPLVEVFDPTIGTDPIAAHRRVDSLELTLTDHPLVLLVPERRDGASRR